MTLRDVKSLSPLEGAAASWLPKTSVIQAHGPCVDVFSGVSIELDFFFEKFPNFKMWQLIRVCFKHCVCQTKHICRQDSSREPAVWTISLIKLPPCSLADRSPPWSRSLTHSKALLLPPGLSLTMAT